MRLSQMPLAHPTLRANSVAPLLLRATLCLVLSLMMVGCRRRTATTGPLAQNVSNYSVGSDNFVVAFGHALQTYTVPSGFELEKQPDNRPVSIRLSEGTIADLLDAVAAQAPDYRWLESGGVVNIMPKKDSESIEKLMNSRVAHFEVHDATSSIIRQAIASLPEVRSWLEQNHVTERSVLGFILPVPSPEPAVASLDVSNASLREIMNRIVKEPGFSSWLFSRYGDQNQYLNIGIN